MFKWVERAAAAVTVGVGQMWQQAVTENLVSDSLTAPPAVRIIHSGQGCNVEEEGYSERVFTIREGGTLELQCIVTGHPRPQVRRHTFGHTHSCKHTHRCTFKILNACTRFFQGSLDKNGGWSLRPAGWRSSAHSTKRNTAD